MRISKLAACVLWMTSFALGAEKHDWLAKVPAAERIRANPLTDVADSATAGAILYRRSCASCHGQEARGSGKHPSLRTERVRQATDGELHWLLTNGNLGAGMPSWSRLPEVQRWQLADYLHSLQMESSGQPIHPDLSK